MDIQKSTYYNDTQLFFLWAMYFGKRTLNTE